MTFQIEQDQCKECPEQCKLKPASGTKCVKGENIKRWMGKKK